MIHVMNNACLFLFEVASCISLSSGIINGGLKTGNSCEQAIEWGTLSVAGRKSGFLHKGTTLFELTGMSIKLSEEEMENYKGPPCYHFLQDWEVAGKARSFSFKLGVCFLL